MNTKAIGFNKKDRISFMYGTRVIEGVVTAVFENIIRVKYDNLNMKELMIKKGFISYNKYELIDLIRAGKITHNKYTGFDEDYEIEKKPISVFDF